MSVPKAPRAKMNPLQRAIADLKAEGLKGPQAIIVHPSLGAEVEKMLAEMAEGKRYEALTLGTPKPASFVPPTGQAISSLFGQPVKSEGPLAKAYREQTEKQQQTDTLINRVAQKVEGTFLHPTRIQGALAATVLEQQLTDSLWLNATMTTPIFTMDDLSRHIGPGHLEGDTAITRTTGPSSTHMLVLCPCMVVLEMNRCEMDRSGLGPVCAGFVVADNICGVHYVWANEVLAQEDGKNFHARGKA